MNNTYDAYPDLYQDTDHIHLFGPEEVESKGCVRRIIRPLELLVERVKKSALGQWVQKYEPNKILTKTFRVINYLQKCINSGLAFSDDVTALKVQKVTKGFWVESKFINNVVKYAKLVAIAASPFTIYNIVKQGILFAKGNPHEKIDAVLQIIDEAASLLDGVTAFSRGLAEVTTIASSTLQWIPVVNIISAVFSGASIAIHARSWWHSNQLMKKISNQISTQDLKEDTDQAGLFIKRVLSTDKNELKKCLDIDGVKLKKSLAKVYNDALGKRVVKDPVKEGKLRAVALGLKNYGQARCTSQILKGIAAVVNTVALIILFSGLLAPLGFALIAVAAVLHLASYAQEKYFFRKLDKLLEEEK